MVQKIKATPQQSNSSRQYSGTPSTSTIDREVPQGIITEQLCHLNEAVTRLAKRTQDTNKMMEKMIELQYEQFDQTKETNSLLGKIYKELQDSGNVLNFTREGIERMEGVVSKTDETSEKHNVKTQEALRALIIAIHGEDAVDRIIKQAKDH